MYESCHVSQFRSPDPFSGSSSLIAPFPLLENVQVRDGNSFSCSLLILPGPSGWDEAVKTVSGWMRGHGGSPPPERLARSGRWPEVPFFDFPWKDHRGFGLGWTHTTITDLFRDIDNVFVGSRENVASRAL